MNTTNDDYFSDVSTGGRFVLGIVTIVLHGFAAMTSFLFGYRFLRLFDIDVTIGGSSVDGIVSGFICVLLVDACMWAFGYMQLNASDTPMQISLAKVVYWSLLALTILMSGIYMSALISGYSGSPDGEIVETGQWLMLVVTGFDLLMTAFFLRSGQAFHDTLQNARHNAAMAHILQGETARIQQEGRTRAKNRLASQGDDIANAIGDTAANGHIGRISPTPARLVPSSGNSGDVPAAF